MDLPTNQIICGDCLEVMKDWPDNCVDLVLTDPPYGVNKSQWDTNALIMWVLDIARISKRDATLISFCGTKQSPYLAIQIDLYYSERQRAIWYCPDKHFYSPRHLIIKTEEAHIGRRGTPYFDNSQNELDMFIENTEPTKLGHPTQKPLSLVIRLIRIYAAENAIIFDPFCGSGTTCVAAKMLGRDYIGIDISEKYCEIARQRLKAVDTGIPVKEQRIGQMALFDSIK